MTEAPKKRRNQYRNKGKESELMQAYRRTIHAAGPAGMTVEELMTHFEVSNQTVNFRVQFLGKTGQIVWRPARIGGKGMKRRWFSPEFAPSMQAAPAPVVKSRAVTLETDAPAVIPPTVKITRAEPFVDRRFAFDPAPGWVGQITQDWRERRLQEVR